MRFWIAGFVLCSLFATCARANESSWRFVILSDIHVDAHDRVAPAFRKVVSEVARLKPDLVVITGDSTSGNPGDHYNVAAVREWWRYLSAAIAPIESAGIPVLPVAGNHDYYRDVHQQAYLEAANAILRRSLPKMGSSTLVGQPPLYYSVEYKGAHLDLLHIVDEKIEPRELEWLRNDLKGAASASATVRFAFGHVPLFSVMGRTNVDFKNLLARVLMDGDVAAYFAGHEHLVWEERLEDKKAGKSLLQFTTGTASATYVFPLRADVRREHCKDEVCKMPASGATFLLHPGTGYERDELSLTVVEVSKSGFKATPYTLKSGKLVPFYAQ